MSRASALQRKGRAGRVRAGVCWGMYTRHRFEHRMRRYQVMPPSCSHLHTLAVTSGTCVGRHGSQLFYPLHPLHHTDESMQISERFLCCIGPNVNVQHAFAHAIWQWIITTSAPHRCSRSSHPVRLCPALLTCGCTQAPEMVRVPLEELVLQIHLLGLGPAAQFLEKVLEPPPKASVEGALTHLQALGALTRDQQLTPLGQSAAAITHDSSGSCIRIASV